MEQSSFKPFLDFHQDWDKLIVATFAATNRKHCFLQIAIIDYINFGACKNCYERMSEPTPNFTSNAKHTNAATHKKRYGSKVGAFDTQLAKIAKFFFNSSK